MDERCKHDLLPGQCSFCLVLPVDPAGQVTKEEFVEGPCYGDCESFEICPSRQRIDHQSPQPGASAGSTANRAISRRRQ